MKKKFIDYYMSIAELTANLSYAERLKVGAVIVKDNQVLGTGYNGMPAGWENKCEEKEWMTDAGGWLDTSDIEAHWPLEAIHDDGTYLGRYRLKTKKEVLHAESNALMKVARSTESSDGATLFCTHAPCIECAKLIYQSGINTVYFKDAYRSTDGIDFLKRSDVNVHQYTSST